MPLVVRQYRVGRLGVVAAIIREAAHFIMSLVELADFL
jgi:hypothetical protein